MSAATQTPPLPDYTHTIRTLSTTLLSMHTKRSAGRLTNDPNDIADGFLLCDLRCFKSICESAFDPDTNPVFAPACTELFHVCKNWNLGTHADCKDTNANSMFRRLEEAIFTDTNAIRIDLSIRGIKLQHQAKSLFPFLCQLPTTGCSDTHAATCNAKLDEIDPATEGVQTARDIINSLCRVHHCNVLLHDLTALWNGFLRYAKRKAQSTPGAQTAKRAK